jgi:2-amino-4-hydroxy-6-hydroxymethyldihydropteridine diphosphokinase
VLEQRDFFNACIRVETALEPLELLDACKQVERELGRQAGGVRHGPRAIDVDVLMLDGRAFESDRLVLPHPSIAERRFVLVPLLELNPPGRARFAEALEALAPGQEVRRVGPPLI